MQRSVTVYHSLREAIRELYGPERHIAGHRQVSGGDINEAGEIVLDDGARLFMKSNAVRAFDNFSAEAEGLIAMRRTGTVQIPALLGIGKDPEGFSFLLMEYIESERPSVKYWEELGRFLIEPEGPSLVHGDLWSGNVMAGRGGTAWLIDPAVYYGHPEVDLAMTELFGRFAGAFYAAYREERPVEAGYEDRRDLYNLYQLLNHLNMFGAAYCSPVRQILKRYAG